MKSSPKVNAVPPKVVRKLLAIFAGNANIDDLIGDMDEWFYENVRTKSLRRAQWIYWGQALSLSFSYALLKRRQDASHGSYATPAFNVGMLQNYVKVAIRNLYQFKYFSIINAFGLALGMSVSLLLISLYSYVRTYDDFQPRAEDVYSITSTVENGAEQTQYATAPAALASKLVTELPVVESAISVVKVYNNVVTPTGSFPVKAYYTNAGFFSLFSFSFVKGDALALDQPGQVVLTARTAERLFGDSDAMGKTIELNGGALVQVAGIIADPRRTHLNCDMLVSQASLPASPAMFVQDWVEFTNQYVYVRMQAGKHSQELGQFLDRTSTSLYKSSAIKVSFGTRRLDEITVGPDLRNEIGEKWEASGFLVFALFALLILLPACFNYANLSIARAMRRAKEIALRKTVGGVRSQIFFQFLTETILITLVSVIIASVMFVLIRNEFQSMLVSGSSLDLSLTPRLWWLFLIFALFTGLFAGIVPAMHFARMNPVEALKSRVTTRTSSFGVRKVLVVFQFVLSFGFLLTLFAINRQYRYAMSFDFGFQNEHLVDVALQDVKPEAFVTAFDGLSIAGTISQSSGILGVTNAQTWLHNVAGDSIATAHMFVDPHYAANLELTFLAGHNFVEEPWTRERYMIVNEEFLKSQKIAAPLDAIGKIYSVDGHDLEVIGVVKNFHFLPLNYPIGNFVFREDPQQYRFANIKVGAGDTYSILSQMEEAWTKLPTEKKFVGDFFRDEMLDAYSSYSAMLKIVGYLGMMAITISLLGMVGMVVYTAQSRTREVGIRKVMGADVSHMVLLLSGDYLKVLMWAVVIGTPLTVLLLNAVIPHVQHYHASISVWDVLMSIGLLMAFGIGTIFLETYKTARINPALTLRSE